MVQYSYSLYTAAVTGDTDSRSDENGPPPTKKRKSNYYLMCTYILIHLYHLYVPVSHTHTTPTLTHTHILPPHTHTHTGAQQVTLRVCPNCKESCHIRCKKCPECEHEFPPSSKSRAKPDQDVVKNPSNLLQILQKKVTTQYQEYIRHMRRVT